MRACLWHGDVFFIQILFLNMRNPHSFTDVHQGDVFESDNNCLNHDDIWMPTHLVKILQTRSMLQAKNISTHSPSFSRETCPQSDYCRCSKLQRKQ